MKNKVKFNKKYHEFLWHRIAEIEIKMQSKVGAKEMKEEMNMHLPQYENGRWRGYDDFSYGEAIKAMLSHLGLELRRKPEEVLLKKVKEK